MRVKKVSLKHCEHFGLKEVCEAAEELEVTSCGTFKISKNHKIQSLTISDTDLEIAKPVEKVNIKNVTLRDEMTITSLNVTIPPCTIESLDTTSSELKVSLKSRDNPYFVPNSFMPQLIQSSGYTGKHI